ncbi:MAG: hypothetical protein ACM3O3_03605 [Syntrophothermus sp.]
MKIELYINNLKDFGYQKGIFVNDYGIYTRTIERYAFGDVVSSLQIIYENDLQIKGPEEIIDGSHPEIFKRMEDIISLAFPQINHLITDKEQKISTSLGSLELLYAPGFGDTEAQLINVLNNTVKILLSEGKPIKR